MLGPVVFLPPGEDSLGVRLPCRPLPPGLWLPGGQTGKGQLPSWVSSQCWLCAFPLPAGVIPLPTPRTRGLENVKEAIKAGRRVSSE